MKKSYSFIFALCLMLGWSSLSAQSSTCMDKAQIANLPGDINNNATYPAGSLWYSDASMDLIKTYPSFQFFEVDWHSTSYGANSISFNFAGWVTLDLSKTTCVNRKVTIEVVCDFIVVDGDTLLTSDLQSADYNNVNFQVKYNAMVYTITGNFNEVLLGGSFCNLYGVCSDPSNCNATGINQKETLIDFVVYPNPANDYVFFDGVQINEMYQLFDTNGKLVISGKVSSSGINVSQLSPGLYIVKVGSNIKKITIQ